MPRTGVSRAILALLVIVFTNLARGDGSTEGQIPPLNGVDLARLHALAAERGLDGSGLAFATVIAEEAVKQSEPELTRDILARAIQRVAIVPRLSEERAALLLARELRGISTQRDATSQSAALTPYASFLLVPYLAEAGLCSGQVVSGPGLVCGYVHAADGGSAVGRMTLAGEEIEVAAPPADSALARVISLAEQYCETMGAQSLYAPASPAVPSTDACVRLRSADARLTVVRLNEAEFDLYYTKLIKEIYDYATIYDIDIYDVILSFLFAFIADNAIDVEVYGEYVLAGNAQYAIDDSDSVFLAFPYGFRCLLKNCEKLVGCAGATDFAACSDQFAERGYWDLRPNGAAIHHSLATCAAFPLPYATRPTYSAIQSGLYPVPQNLKFETHYQVPPALPIGQNDTHLYPASTAYRGATVVFPYTSRLGNLPTWDFGFSNARSWEPNFIFAGLKSIPPTVLPGEPCTRAKLMLGRVVYGESFWSYEGFGHDDTRSCDQFPLSIDTDCPDYIARGNGSFPMPDFSVVFGQALAHEPITCGAPTSLLAVGPGAAQEGERLTFEITRAGNVTAPISVSYTTAGGSATLGHDFVLTEGRVTFQPNDVAKSVQVPTIKDGTFEGAESMSLRLFNASEGGEVVVQEGTGAIVDTPATFAVATASAEEGQPLSFVVHRQGNASVQATVNYQTVDGTAIAGADYQTVSGTLTFLPGNTQKSVIVNTILDATHDPAETMTLRLSQQSANAVIGIADATGTIRTTTRQCATSELAWGTCKGTALPTLVGSRATVANTLVYYQGPSSKKAQIGEAEAVCEVNSTGGATFRIVQSFCTQDVKPEPPPIFIPCDPGPCDPSPI